ncbi:MAG TPA: DUF4375 domain-containing protein [Tepidisphaeraceae bacterium]|jgi:hypothetical protein|nr:DUF4375 domain-containing protein [Tepidisphaeraceae bacterium]
MSDFAFKKLPRSLLSEGGKRQRLFELIWRAIADQVEDPPFITDPDRLQKIPVEARTIYLLWYFQCEAAGGGIESFVLGSPAASIRETHTALQLVGAAKLVRYLEAAIAIARLGPAEFKKSPDQTWLRQFSSIDDHPTLQSISKSGYAVMDSLTDAVLAFARANEQILFEP